MGSGRVGKAPIQPLLSSRGAEPLSHTDTGVSRDTVCPLLCVLRECWGMFHECDSAVFMLVQLTYLWSAKTRFSDVFRT